MKIWKVVVGIKNISYNMPIDGIRSLIDLYVRSFQICFDFFDTSLA